MSEIHSVGPFILGKSLGAGATGVKSNQICLTNKNTPPEHVLMLFI